MNEPRIKKTDHIKPKRTIFLMVEGESEDAYFHRVARIFDRYSIITKVSKDKRCKDLIINCAKEAQRRGLDDDDIKVAVFDLDVVSVDEMREAVAIANKEGVMLMVSNLSFEIWLLMHLEDVSRVYTQDDYERRLSAILNSEYIKSKGLKDKVNLESITGAIKRGKSILVSRDTEKCKSTPNSSTLWYLLSIIVTESGKEDTNTHSNYRRV